MLNCASEDQNPICVTRQELDFCSENHRNLFGRCCNECWRLTTYEMNWIELAQYTVHMLLTFYIQRLHRALGLFQDWKTGWGLRLHRPGSKLRPKSWKESAGRRALVHPLLYSCSILGVPSYCFFQGFQRLCWWVASFRWSEIATYWYLVGGLEHFIFSHILGIIIPID